jgi:GH15 family glucan-1,4-alpha-glucosidase
MAVRGRGLYINVLYFQALKCGSMIAQVMGDQNLKNDYLKKSILVKDQINNLMWVDLEKEVISNDFFLDEEANILLGQKLSLLNERPFYLPYISFRNYGTWFDSLGNLLAIIFGVADDKKANLILDYIQQTGVDSPFLVKAIYPPITPGHLDWRGYYFNRNLNIPNHYHNGGIWPFIGGFYVLALVASGRLDQAGEQLNRLAQANKKGKTQPWGFNEWLHGITGEPMGHDLQAWSAAMYIYAYQAVKQKQLLLF